MSRRQFLPIVAAPGTGRIAPRIEKGYPAVMAGSSGFEARLRHVQPSDQERKAEISAILRTPAQSAREPETFRSEMLKLGKHLDRQTKRLDEQGKRLDRQGERFDAALQAVNRLLEPR